jgi:chitinase
LKRCVSHYACFPQYGFDGIDIDWEYPGDTTRGGQAADIQNFPLLVQAVRNAADAAGKQIVISLAITVGTSRLATGYDLAALAKYVDFFNLMAYDIHGDWDIPQVIGAHTDLSYIKQSVEYFLKNGVTPDKMVLGLAAYGHTYYLSDPTCITPGCGFTAGGPGGCAGATGDMPYFTIDQYVQSKNYNSLTFNPSTSSMEMVISGNVWISFDNPYTLGIKASYAASTCMRGTMWWAVDLLASPIVLGTSPTTPTSPTRIVVTQPASPINFTPAPVTPSQAPVTNAPLSQTTPTPTTAPSKFLAESTPAPIKPTRTPHTRASHIKPTKSHPSKPTQSPVLPQGSPSGVFIVSTASRCGVSELDSRGNCNAVCQQQNDCASGQWCWTVFPNYCGSKTVRKCTDLSQADSDPRCGVDELHARELCGNKCVSDNDCSPGQSCFSVELNTCDC